MTIHIDTPVAVTEVGSASLQRLAYTVGEAADMLSVTSMTIYRWIRAGKIRTVKLGGCRRISRAELERVLAEGL